MFALIHGRGCGLMVINMMTIPDKNAPIAVGNLIHLNGELVLPHEAPRCDSCGCLLCESDFDDKFIVEFQGGLQ